MGYILGAAGPRSHRAGERKTLTVKEKTHSLKLAGGVLKALFTTNPTKTSQVRVTEDGEIKIEDVPDIVDTSAYHPRERDKA
jgi:hypothetical protein